MAAYIDEDLNDPAKLFTAFLWTGDGTSPRSITGVGFQANLMWSKTDVGHEHSVVDTVRGVDNKRLKTDSDAAEDTTNTHGHFDSLDSDGFTVTGASGYYNVNRDTDDYVGWFWKESVAAGFDIIGYTGNGGTQDISHSLSAKPDFMILKKRSASGGWLVYHSDLGAEKAIYLNETGAVGTNSSGFNDTEPTSSVFSLGSGAYANTDGGTHICYAWAEKQGFSKFGTYTGNGNADGHFVYTGFRPAWLMVKRTDGTDYWYMFDNKRDPDNVIESKLEANTNAAFYTSVDWVDFCANGFKWRYTGGGINASGGSYIYMAFAEAPFVNSNGAPANAR